MRLLPFTFNPYHPSTIAVCGSGHYKYGWRAAPRKYSNPETVVKSSAAVASRAALAALTGIAKKSPMPQPAAPRRASFDVTRVERKPCEENRRQSMDTHKVGLLPSGHIYRGCLSPLPRESRHKYTIGVIDGGLLVC